MIEVLRCLDRNLEATGEPGTTLWISRGMELGTGREEWILTRETRGGSDEAMSGEEGVGKGWEDVGDARKVCVGGENGEDGRG